jgi:DNA replication protein DnaC
MNLDFINNNEIGLFLGSPGTGKSHCAIAIGMKAAQAGHSVYCTSVKKLATKIRLANQKNTMDILFRQILSSKLWILDDWGVVSMPRDVSEEVFDLFDRRKQNSAMIITSNRDVDEWPQVFSDPVIAGSAIDRMFENANLCIFTGPSYRMKGRIIFNEIDNDQD